FPVQVIAWLDVVNVELFGRALEAGDQWWLLAPVPGRQVSYGPLIFLVAITAVMLLTVLVVRHFYHERIRRADAWDCGFNGLDARMQDTAEGFGQPIRNIFQSFFLIQREQPVPTDRAPRYSITIKDRLWRVLYEPLGTLVERLADMFAVLQRGRISVYLTYSFVTLVVLLALVL